MMNETQLAVWTKNLLVDHKASFIDEEGDAIHYEVGGDHAELASDIFSVDICTVTVEKDGVALGGIGFANEYCDEEKGAITDVYNFSSTCVHLIQDFV